jgi:Flp pilus assembly protein TadG
MDVLKRIRTSRVRWERARQGPRGRRKLGEAGQALVEVAIALPILLALLVGIFEFARAYNVQQVITNAAREGAREGVLPPSGSASSQARAVPRAQARLSDANIVSGTVTFTCTGGCDTGDQVSVTVSVDYTFVFIGPILSLFSSGVDPGTITLRSTATMRKE